MRSSAVSVRHNRRRLDLDLRAVLDEGRDLHQGHGREMAADHLAVGLADFSEARDVLLLVGHVPGEADQVFGLGAALGRYLLAVPADLAGDEDERAARSDAVGIAFRFRPGLGIESFHAWAVA